MFSPCRACLSFPLETLDAAEDCHILPSLECRMGLEGASLALPVGLFLKIAAVRVGARQLCG